VQLDIRGLIANTSQLNAAYSYAIVTVIK